ncbi:hypothetical protein B0T25DRAFT_576379 [Lasiosphaeria hispida]|uniref:Heterokaryon incompatibility domain-containing protein n=1 Tax=Lasiosphaeria hispida TaxID=260671 RepID=A0AAJ0HW57_9PEZI|nr:hypothetical protein B0T25DRAFT_576379 [Lasiosphaeria hispida]
MNLIARWVNTCVREHTTCRAVRPIIPSDAPLFPTRLLEVGNHENPVLRLIYSKDIPAKQPWAYLTLTHRWGGLSFMSLVTANHDEFLVSIPYDELTHTFQDVVNLARSIKNVNYVWIDSLCIMQDSPADKSTEIVQMQDIYIHSLFTITAAHAKDGRGGCTSQRDPNMVAPLVVSFARPQTWRTMLSSLFPPILPADPPDGDYVCVDPGIWHHPKWLHLTSSPWRHLEQMMDRGEVIWDGISRSSSETSGRESSVPAKKSSVSSGSSTSSLPPLSGTQWEFLGATGSESAFLDLCEASEMPKESLDTVAQMLEQSSYAQGREETEISRNVRFWQNGFRAGYEAAKNGLLSSAKPKRTNEFVPVKKLVEDGEFDEFRQFEDGIMSSHLLLQGTNRDCRTDVSSFSAASGIEDDGLQLDWESFELGTFGSSADSLFSEVTAA